MEGSGDDVFPSGQDVWEDGTCVGEGAEDDEGGD